MPPGERAISSLPAGALKEIGAVDGHALDGLEFGRGPISPRIDETMTMA
jgi:hypothetical protein